MTPEIPTSTANPPPMSIHTAWFTDAPLSLDELSYLLWATQGVRGQDQPAQRSARRTSAGCRHAFETYLVIQRVDEGGE